MSGIAVPGFFITVYIKKSPSCVIKLFVYFFLLQGGEGYKVHRGAQDELSQLFLFIA
jgi:hypothetical protein